MKTDLENTIAASTATADLAVYRISLRIVFYLILPILTALAVYEFIMEDYLSFAVLTVIVVLDLGVVFAVRRTSLSQHEPLVYKYTFNFQVTLLLLFFLYAVGFQDRYELFPWCLSIVFLAFLVYPPGVRIPAAAVFLTILGGITYLAAPDITISGRDLLVNYIPSFLFIIILLYIMHYVSRNNNDIRARAEREHRRNEEELLRQKAYLEELIEAAPEAIAVLHTDDTVERINTEFTRLFGYTSEEAVGRTINELISGPGVDEETQRFSRITREGETIKGESVRRRKDGREVQVSILGTRVKGEHGLDRMYAIYRDISARKKAEKAQRETYEALITIFDSIDTDIHVSDFKTGRILFMNKHMKENFGHNMEGKRCHKVFRDRDDPCPDCRKDQILDQAGVPKGLIVWESVNPVTGRFYINQDRAIKWIDGRYAHLHVATDATDRKETEKNLNRRIREMSALNSLGTKVNASLSSEEVIQAAMAEVRTATGAGLILLFLRDGGNLELAASDSADLDWNREDLPKHKVGLCLCGLAVDQGRPVYSSDIAVDPRRDLQECLTAGARSFAALPLIAGQEIIGILGLADRSEVDYTEQGEFLETMAHEIAIGLYNAKLFEEIQRHTVRLEETVRNLEETQNALRYAEQKFAIFTDNMPAMAFMKDASGRYVFANKAFKHSLGLDPEKMINRTDKDFWPEEMAAVFRETDRRTETQGVVETTGTILDMEGREHAHLTYKFPIHRSGEPDLIGGITVDITERVAAEEAVRRSESVARALLDLIPDTISRLRKDGTFTFFKPPADGSPILSPNPVGRNIRDYVSPKVASEVQTLIKEVLSRGIMAKHEYTIEIDGSTYNRETRYIRYGEDEIMAVAQDTTERKSLEEQLAQAQRMEAIGVLASGIAHDFNNILQAMSGHTQLLLSSDDLAERHRDRIARIDRTIRRASGVVRRLLTFSRKGEVRFEPLDLNREIGNTVELLRHSLPKMIEIELDLGKNIRAVSGDPGQIEQLLMNLGTNARDAMPDGGKLVFQTRPVSIRDDHLPNHSDPPPGEYVRLRVTDSGLGMEPQVAAHIFEPFYTTKEVGHGTGLGLFTAYGIVRSHKGRISCDSVPGEGTCFSILLPALEAGDVSAQREETPRPRVGAESGTILLVDDEEPIRDTTREYLTNCGYDVLTAADGETALDIFSRRWKEIRLVVLDLGMPGMGGQKALSGLLDINPEAKVLVASGYSVGNQAKEVLEEGAAGFIGKPYRLADLLNRVREILG